MNEIAWLALSLLVLTATSIAGAQGAGSGVQERVAALKQSLAQSQQLLRTYQWVETTTVRMHATMGSLTDGTTYTARTQLFLTSDQLVVNVANSGNRKM
jgi:hypothetical protein